MTTTRSRTLLVCLVAAAVLAPTGVRAGGGNNLNVLAAPGVKLGIARVSGKTLFVQLERTKPRISPPMNDSYLRITDVPAGADVTPPVGGQSFAAAFPNGAYELADVGWGDFRFRELLAWKGCLQVAGADGTGYDLSRVYCDKTKVTRIKIGSGTGSDAVAVDPAIAVPVTHKCTGRRDPCGTLGCVEAPTTCCDAPAGLEGCLAREGLVCTDFDPNDPSTFPFCPQF